MELHDKNLKEILSHSKLELPFPDFENRMLEKIQDYEAKRLQAEKNRFFSHVCFLVGIILGTVLTYLINKDFDWSQITFLTKENYYFLTQIIYVVLIVLFADKLWKLSKSDIKNLFK